MSRYLAEAIATFILVFVGAGSVLAGGSRLEIAAAHGLALMVAVFATAHISGAHVNPAVTIAMWATKRIKGPAAVGYIISQLIGAAIAGYLLAFVFGNTAAAVNNLAAGVTLGTGTVVEAVLTFLLVFTIFAVAVDKKMEAAHVGIVLGAVLAFAHLVALGVTGSSLNPARTFGPALASGFWANHLVYWVGPIVGAIIAALLYQAVFMKKRR